jgi:hypothetical protein
MNRQEAVKERRRLRPDVPQKIAVGAVALCMKCPRAAICPTKAPGECPLDLAEQLIDDGGDYAPPIKTSYLQDLLDDSKPTVKANLVRKPLPPPSSISCSARSSGHSPGALVGQMAARGHFIHNATAPTAIFCGTSGRSRRRSFTASCRFIQKIPLCLCVLALRRSQSVPATYRAQMLPNRIVSTAHHLVYSHLGKFFVQAPLGCVWFDA